MIKILHTADLHLDAPFSGCTPSERTARRNEQRQVLRNICSICKKEKINLLLIAGDLFDSDFVRADTPAFIAECFESIPDTYVFISPGNHDPYYERSPYRAAKFPGNVHIFMEETLSHFDIPSLNTTVYGFGFEKRGITGNPIDGLRVRDDTKINILLCHGDLDDAASEYFNIKADDLEGSFLNYAALGHIHKAGEFMRFGKTACAYCGTPLGRGFDECGEKSVIVGEIGIGNAALLHMPIEGRRYEIAKVNLDGCRSEQAALSKISDICGDYGENAALRIVLSGNVQTEIRISAERVRSVLAKPRYIEIKDETLYLPDMEELMRENSLRGEFCRKIKPMLESEDASLRKTAALALKYGLSALSGE